MSGSRRDIVGGMIVDRGEGVEGVDEVVGREVACREVVWSATKAPSDPMVDSMLCRTNFICSSVDV